MFQRQMSTNALTNRNSSAGGSSGQSGRPSGGPRMFQRQMTASQLFSGASGASGHQQHPQDNNSNNNNNNGNGKKRLLNAARADTNLASSATCLATNNSSAALQASSSRSRMGDSSTAESVPGKKPGKNKRIISRMLSISAIHTTVGSGGGGASGSQSGQESPSSSSGGFHPLHSHGGGGGGGSGNCSSSDTIQACDQTPAAATFGAGSDKFSDSSFRRSRSSSTSSTTGHSHGGFGAHSHNQQQQQANESILCLAFVDPALAGSGAVGQPGLGTAGVTCPAAGGAPQAFSGSGQTGAIINSSTGGAGGGAGCGASGFGGASAGPAAQSSAGANHKSLSLNDNYNQQASGQLALWLGTSSGALLLVALQMPDNEDNRILQLQSITAEPLPHASIKLIGQILSIAPFTCEARLQSGGQAQGASGHQQQAASQAGNTNSSSSGFQSVGSASSSLEGDTLIQSSPGCTGSSSAAGVGATSGGNTARLESIAGGSFDTRSSLFLAIVSEKQARVYQVPANGPAPSGGHAPSAGHHHHHHHHHSPPQQQQQQADQQPGQASFSSSTSSWSPPLASLLTNKRNLVAECDLSESSYACRSQVVHMRSPDECCLVSYLATGNLLVHALPRLRPVLLDADFVPYSSPRISSSMCLSRQGHGLYQPSPGEICKFTVSGQYKALVNDMMGLLYVPREMPEMPRTNFFKSLFSVSPAARQSDRDELFGEAGRPSRGVAHHSTTGGPGASSGLDKLKQAAVGTMGHDMRVAREGLDERGEKLSEIEDRTLQMMNQSETYAQAAHQLAQKFKDKKWYQF